MAAFFVDCSFAFATANCVIGLAGFARAVHDAAHDCYFEGLFAGFKFYGFESGFDFFCESFEIDFCSTAGWTRDKKRFFCVETQGFEEFFCGFYFLDWIFCEGNSYGVADAFSEENA